jgi:VanZ family protein
MQDRARGIEPNFALIAAGVAILIAYGSLYPFRFHSHFSNGPIGALIGTWCTPTGRGDLLANLLLYLPFGLFSFPAFGVALRPARIALVIAGGLCLSVSLELAQFYDQGRDSAMADVYANTAGTALGAAAGALLFSKQRRSHALAVNRRPFVLLILGSWVGYRMTPFAPTIDLHKYWMALKPLVISPVLPPLDLYRHAVITLALAVLLEALLGPMRSRIAILVLVAAVLVARVLILDTALSPAEVAGGAIGIAVYSSLLWRLRVRSQVIAGLFAGVVVIQGLQPFHFSTTPHPFGWTPFLGFMQGSVEVNIRSLFEKVFSYGALVWLTTRAGCKFRLAVGLTGGLVLCLRLGQVFLPGRSADITDVIMLLMLAVVTKLMCEDPAGDLTRDATLVGGVPA